VLQTALKSARKQWEAEFSLREQKLTQTVREYEVTLQDTQAQLGTLRSQLLSEQTALSDSDRRLAEARVGVGAWKEHPVSLP
jgi:chromosome segregation ATPase